jgi:hypothetical protein
MNSAYYISGRFRTTWVDSSSQAALKPDGFAESFEEFVEVM